ncbi:unnamed protein product [Aureobasidium uvarum]|uniref:Uncharacterized protein n=1 Tax=Aureobasidium uvarum TaxID=2773716 RepID=A0A9N8PRJ3_9PEZI|nr:unnamed protein product [Aureobasidium uvarum]
MTSTTGDDLTNAVHISCSADKPTFESVTLTIREIERLMIYGHSSPDGMSYDSSQISRRIGTPLRTTIDYQYKGPPEVGMGWSYALALHTLCEPDTMRDLDGLGYGWGCNNGGWNTSLPADVYVIREDGNPLCPKLLEAL